MRDALAKTAKRSRQGRRNHVHRRRPTPSQNFDWLRIKPEVSSVTRNTLKAEGVLSVEKGGGCGLDLTPLRGFQISPAQSNRQAALRAA